jgi:hypothetical protein
MPRPIKLVDFIESLERSCTARRLAAFAALSSAPGMFLFVLGTVYEMNGLALAGALLAAPVILWITFLVGGSVFFIAFELPDVAHEIITGTLAVLRRKYVRKGLLVIAVLVGGPLLAWLMWVASPLPDRTSTRIEDGRTYRVEQTRRHRLLPIREWGFGSSGLGYSGPSYGSEQTVRLGFFTVTDATWHKAESEDPRP